MNRYRFVDEKKEHLHLLDDKPLVGTSTAINVLSKNLTWWSAELSAIECLEAGTLIPTIREEYLEAKKEGKPGIDKLQKKYPIFKKARFAHFESKNQKAEEGVDLHLELENYCVGCIERNAGLPMETESEHQAVKIFSEWANGNAKRFIASEAHCYSERLWTGGITDLIFEDKEGRYGVLDFKSAKEAYQSMFFQCAGYDIAISENGILDKDGNLIMKLEKPIEFYAIFPFGMEKPEPQFNFDVEECKKAFELVVALHKIINK